MTRNKEQNKKTLNLRQKSNAFRLDQVITIKQWASRGIVFKKILHAKNFELLNLIEVSLDQLQNLTLRKKALETWKTHHQVNYHFLLQIKDMFWNSPEDHVSILAEQNRLGTL